MDSTGQQSDKDILTGMGTYHKKELERSFTNRFQISSAHDWKIEVHSAANKKQTEENLKNPKEMAQEQQRSALDSRDLQAVVSSMGDITEGAN